MEYELEEVERDYIEFYKKKWEKNKLLRRRKAVENMVNMVRCSIIKNYKLRM